MRSILLKLRKSPDLVNCLVDAHGPHAFHLLDLDQTRFLCEGLEAGPAYVMS